METPLGTKIPIGQRLRRIREPTPEEKELDDAREEVMHNLNLTTR